MKTKILVLISIVFLSMISLSSALVINSVSTYPKTISPGETSSVVISLKNNGDIDLTDVSVSLDFTNLPLAPYDSSSEYSFNELNEGKTKEAEFQIIAFNDAVSGIYKIPIKIEYNEDDVIKTKQSIISITISSEPIIEVGYDNGLLLFGQKNQVTINVINKGLGDVKFLELEIESSSSYNILSQNKVYLGDIDSNDFQTEDFDIYFNPSSLKSINLPVTIRYKDIANKEYTKNYDIQLKVYSKEQAQKLGLIPKDNTIYIVLGVIALIVVFFIYRIIRKRKRQNKIQ